MSVCFHRETFCIQRTESCSVQRPSDIFLVDGDDTLNYFINKYYGPAIRVSLFKEEGAMIMPGKLQHIRGSVKKNSF